MQTRLEYMYGLCCVFDRVWNIHLKKIPVFKLVDNSQFTISSTTAVTVSPTPLLTTRVKFFVLKQVALSMMNAVVATEVSVFNSSVFLYQDTFDNGLLEIFRVIVTFSLSFNICNGLLSMVGVSKITNNWIELILKSFQKMDLKIKRSTWWIIRTGLIQLTNCVF